MCKSLFSVECPRSLHSLDWCLKSQTTNYLTTDRDNFFRVPRGILLYLTEIPVFLPPDLENIFKNSPEKQIFGW
jgi:hypothetical protein